MGNGERSKVGESKGPGPGAPPKVVRRRYGTMPIGFEHASSDAEVVARTKDMIARSLRGGRMIGFVGSGVSNESGYPLWKEFVQKLRKWFVEEYRSEIQGVDEAVAEPSKEGGADALYFCLEMLSRVAQKNGVEDALKDHVRSEFKRGPGKREDSLSLEALIAHLGIRRFFTLNFDHEISIKLAEKLKIGLPHVNWRRRTAEELRITPGKPGSAAEEDWVNGLIELALGSPGARSAVFHCHGDCGGDGALILTESDSQRRYLGEDSIQRIYRRGLRLALVGNPVLFVGTGLGEREIVRPLSQVVVNRSLTQTELPLFALMFGGNDDEKLRLENEHYRRMRRHEFRLRYGIKVLFVPGDFEDCSENPNVQLSEAIRSLDSWRRRCASGWNDLPMARTPKFWEKSEHQMIRHALDWFTKVDDELSELAATVIRRSTSKHPILIHGKAGAAKGRMSSAIADANLKLNRPLFYASLHFTNEYLSTIQGAVRHLGKSSQPSTCAPIDAFRQLRVHRHMKKALLIISGIERLLKPLPADASIGDSADHGDWTFGVPVNREAERVLEALASLAAARQFRVVLMSSLVPLAEDSARQELLAESHERPLKPLLSGFEVIPLRRHPTASSLESWEQELGGLLEHHAYMMDLVRAARKHMSGEDGEDKGVWTERLIDHVSSVPGARRLELVFQFILQVFLKRDGDDADSIRELLQLAALLTTPVPAVVFETCLEGSKGKVLEQRLTRLHDANLLLRIKVSDVPPRYTAHTVLRNFILHSLGEHPSLPGEHHIFELGAFHQDSRVWRLSLAKAPRSAARWLDRILDELERPDGSSGEAGDPEVTRHLVRSAFGLIRANWSATSIAGQARARTGESGKRPPGSRPLIEMYQVRLGRLLTALLSFPENIRSEGELGHEKDAAHLYEDEIVWIYNELGWAYFCAGSLTDAWMNFRSVKHLSARIEGESPSHRSCRASLNLAHLAIERASLDRARRRVEEAFLRARELRDTDAEGQAHLLLGLIEHLSARFGSALTQYGRAVSLLESVGNTRGLSAAYRHRADLLRASGADPEEVDRDLNWSRIVAEAGSHSDLYWYSRVAHCHFRASRQDRPVLGDQDSLDHALTYARDVGLRSLEADVQKVQASIALERGDLGLAEQLVFENLSTCTANGMRIRTTSATVLLGRIAKQQQNLRLARRSLNTAIQFGLQQGYHLQVEAARRELINLGTSPG